MGFDLSQYETVAERLHRWLTTDHDAQPRVITDLVHYNDQRCVFRAELYLGDVLIATGWAEETRGDGHVNRTSHLENCESSAVGRALANAGLSGSDPAKRPSREEMDKVQRYSEPRPTVTVAQSGAGVTVRGSAGKATEAQRKFIQDLVKKLDMKETIVSDLTGKSVAELEFADAQLVLNGLLAIKKGTANLTYDNNGKAVIAAEDAF